MAISYVDLDDVYPIANNNNLNLEISVGDGQPNYSISVFLDQERKGTSELIPLGTVDDVGGKKVMIVIVVQDRLTQTNWTSFTAKIKQGGAERIFGPYKKQAENHLDTIIYTLKIEIQ
ncbi:MAG: hypothetical protein AABY93_08400 [Bacteroidota bacterium]